MHLPLLGRYGLTVFRMYDQGGLGLPTLPTTCMSMTGENGAPVPVAVEPIASSGSFLLDDNFGDLLMLTMPLTLAPIRSDARRHTAPRGSSVRPKAAGTLSEGF
jgi:hypothetical protein